MKRFICALILSSAAPLCGCVAQASTSSPGPASPPSTKTSAFAATSWSKINQYMNAEMKVNHFMGSVLVARGDHVILAKGYGKANIKKNIPNTPNTKFHIGSVTKQFTAMAILMLQNEGKLNVRDHICQYVPKCPDDWQSITIYNLLTHTSGIPDYVNLEIMSQSWTPTQLLALFKDKPLKFKPGTKFSYSNSGYVVLGYIIEQVSGESYGKFFAATHIQPAWNEGHRLW